jgi:hypothetical protein
VFGIFCAGTLGGLMLRANGMLCVTNWMKALVRLCSFMKLNAITLIWPSSEILLLDVSTALILFPWLGP